MPRPNILLIHTDQQRWDALGANGNLEIETPNIDRLASEGISFTRCFTQATVCGPSRASYRTGLYPSQLGIYENGRRLPEDVETLARLLSTKGYTSATIGKLHFLPHSFRDHRETHPDYGFDQIEVSDEPGCYDDDYRAWVKRTAPDQLADVSLGLPWAAEGHQDLMFTHDDIDHPEVRFPKRPVPFKADDDLTHSAYVARRTNEFLRSRGSEPFLCVSGFYSPHSPWVAPERFIDRYDPDALSIPEFPEHLENERAGMISEDPEEAVFSDEELRLARQGYYAMVTEVDYWVGEILDTLEAEGLAQNTIVVFTSDHGEDLGDHLHYGKGWPGYDSITRVPLIVRWPEELADPGRSESGIVEAVDLVPTLLQCAERQVPTRLRGESLLPAFRADGYEGRDSALTQAQGARVLRTDRYRYATDGTDELLFDLTEDPGEYHDVSGEEDYRKIQSELRHRLLTRTMQAERRRAKDAPY